MAHGLRNGLALALAALATIGCNSALFDGGGTASRALSVAADAPREGLYGVTGGREFVFVDPETAEATVIGPVGLPIGTVGADFACDGTFWALSGTSGGMILYTVDLATGAGHSERIFPGLSGGSGFEFGLDEKTPYWRNGTGLFRLDVAAGTTEQVATLQGSGVSLTVPPSCDAFLSGTTYSTNRIDRIDPVTFATTPALDPIPYSFASLAAAPDGRLYGDASGKLVRIDLAAGVVEVIGTISTGEASLTVLGMAWGPHGVCCAAPDCSAAKAVTPTLWPPDHRFVEVGIDGVVAPGGAPVAVTIASVRQDEPVDGRGDGATGPDAEVADGLLRLRAERAGGGNGRVYQVGFTATAGGAACSGTVSVCVPHDAGRGATCVDDGPAFDSTAP